MAEHIRNVSGPFDESLEITEKPDSRELVYRSPENSGSVVTSGLLSMPERPHDQALVAREKRGWGPKFRPAISDEPGRNQYRMLCEDIYEQAAQLKAHVRDGSVPDEAAGLVAEIQSLLEKLYDCRFGEGESLKSVVVAIQSQLNNVEWAAKHVDFLDSVIHYLRNRWIVNDRTADEVDDMIEEHGLDLFRGSVSDIDVAVSSQ